MAAEAAYAALAADEQADVSNYADLVAAREAYDALAAQPSYDGTTFVLADATINAGESAEIELTLSNKPQAGIAAVTIKFTYDKSVLSFTKAAKSGGIFDTVTLGQVSYGSKIVADAEEDVFEGKVATVTIAVDANAVSGTYPIVISSNDCSNYDMEDVDVDSMTAYITVVGASAPAVEPEVGMGVTVENGSDIAPALYIDKVTEDEAQDITVIVNGVETTLADCELTDSGYKLPIGTFSAKNMGDDIAYEIKDGETVLASGNTSVKAYAEALASTPGYEEVGSAMLAYGAAAQVQFGYETENLVTDTVVTDPVVGEKFDATAIKAQMNGDASIPVVYNAMNVTFLDEVTLNLAFKVKAGFTTAQAIDWMKANVTFGGAAVDPEVRGKFLVISKTNIAISQVMDPIALVVAGETYYVSVLNYLAAVEEAGTASESMKNLARAFYAYVNAMNSIA